MDENEVYETKKNKTNTNKRRIANRIVQRRRQRRDENKRGPGNNKRERIASSGALINPGATETETLIKRGRKEPYKWGSGLKLAQPGRPDRSTGACPDLFRPGPGPFPSVAFSGLRNFREKLAQDK